MYRRRIYHSEFTIFETSDCRLFVAYIRIYLSAMHSLCTAAYSLSTYTPSCVPQRHRRRITHTPPSLGPLLFPSHSLVPLRYLDNWLSLLCCLHWPWYWLHSAPKSKVLIFNSQQVHVRVKTRLTLRRFAIAAEAGTAYHDLSEEGVPLISTAILMNL